MKRFTYYRVFAALAALSGLVMSCATSVESIGGEGGGGEGGDDASSTVGSGPICAKDCSTLEAEPCFIGQCNAETHQCEIVPDNGALCDDGVYCTVGEVCKDGVCSGGSANPCDEVAGDGCSGAVCDEESKTCIVQSLPDGTPCFIDEPCIVNAACKAGACVGAPKDCFFAPVPDACHVSACSADTGMCEPIPGNDGSPCPNDGDLCKVDKVCQGGMCLGGVPKNCSAFTNGCNNGVCDPATGDCFGEPVPPGGMCLEATTSCSIGFCDMNGACVPTAANDGMACDDGNSCTINDVCAAAACAGMPDPGYVVYFSETFASNAAGWTIGTEWAIGSAVASNGFPTGNEDPGQDHTASADNGIAGVVIGGYAQEVIHPMYYLESPTFNGDAAGALHLQYWRFLNSDYTPFMNNVVEVYDGSQWILLWESGPDQMVDFEWTFATHDITAYKTPSMKIRFGFDIGSGGVFTVSSWNLDDVVVASAPCP